MADEVTKSMLEPARQHQDRTGAATGAVRPGSSCACGVGCYPTRHRKYEGITPEAAHTAPSSDFYFWEGFEATEAHHWDSQRWSESRAAWARITQTIRRSVRSTTISRSSRGESVPSRGRISCRLCSRIHSRGRRHGEMGNRTRGVLGEFQEQACTPAAGDLADATLMA